MARYNDLDMNGHKLKGLVSGTATLVGGTATIENANVTATSKILLMRTAAGGTVGDLSVSTRTAGVGFVITSVNILDTSTVEWMLFT